MISRSFSLAATPVIDRVVAARAAAEGDELRFGVVGMLAGQARVLRRDAGAGGAVAAGAGRDAARRCRRGRSSRPARPRPCSWPGRAWPSCWRRRRRRCACPLRTACEAIGFMIGVVALAGLELGELLDEVVGVLALQDRVGGDAARAVAVWQAAQTVGRDRCALGGVRLGRRRLASSAIARRRRSARATRTGLHSSNSFMGEAFGGKPDDFTMTHLGEAMTDPSPPAPPAPAKPVACRRGQAKRPWPGCTPPGS